MKGKNMFLHVRRYSVLAQEIILEGILVAGGDATRSAPLVLHFVEHRVQSAFWAISPH